MILRLRLLALVLVTLVGVQETRQLRPYPSWLPFAPTPTDFILHQGDNLQTAINNAQPGDTITLDAGAEFVGSFSLPVKSGSSYVTIRSSALSGLSGGIRVSPGSIVNMATIRASIPNEPAFATSGAAHHYRFQGLEIKTTSGVAADAGIVRLGASSTETSLSQVTHDFDIDRCYIHGQPGQNVLRGVIANGQDTTVQNSYISEIHYIGSDSQAIISWTSPGGLHVINDYLEASGENMMVGGADPKIVGLVPGMTGGIEVRRNTFFKPLSWKVGDPSYAGFHWTVKNLFELKNAINVTVDGNTFTNNWVDAQDGTAILFTVRNQDCTAPWSTVQNVTYTNNTLSGVAGAAYNMLGFDNEAEPAFGKCTNPDTDGSVRGTNLTLQNNLDYDVHGAFLQLTGFYNVTINHNTDIRPSGNTITFAVQQATGFIYRNQLQLEQPFGIFGDGGTQGTAALNTWTPGYVFEKDVMVGAAAGVNPAGTCGGITCYPATVATVQFVDFTNGNYALLSSSPYHNAATDGTDIGVNMTALLAAQANVTITPRTVSGKVTLGGKVTIQ